MDLGHDRIEQERASDGTQRVLGSDRKRRRRVLANALQRRQYLGQDILTFRQ